ncbi:MAG: 50S ribosomal protein L15 [Candidatus Omnitrophica bacterium]|nr:50S ribosomal protein L15 [Candidatus Omnitrophota bacterium]
MKKKILQKKPLKVRKSSKRRLKKKSVPQKVSKQIARIWGLHNLKPAAGSHKHRKILGRGSGSGHGKTSTRGSKGQTSRSGKHLYLGFEGGQSPLIRKIPKRGFSGRSHKEYQIVNLENLVRNS